MDKKEFSNEMRGTLFVDDSRTNDKAPIATGTLTVSGVELQIAMWPSRVAGGTGKAAGKKFWPIAVEYRQGTKFFLAPVSPADVVVTAAQSRAAAAPAKDVAAVEPALPDVEDMPF